MTGERAKRPEHSPEPAPTREPGGRANHGSTATTSNNRSTTTTSNNRTTNVQRTIKRSKNDQSRSATMNRKRTLGNVLPVAAVAVTAAALAGAPARADDGGESGIRHVLVISVDGMHQVDLEKYVASHPNSTF